MQEAQKQTIAQTAAKLSQAEAYAEQCCNGAALGREVAKPLASQIGRRINRENENIAMLYRAQDILQRHPEFEELAWLIRSGLV